MVLRREQQLHQRILHEVILQVVIRELVSGRVQNLTLILHQVILVLSLRELVLSIEYYWKVDDELMTHIVMTILSIIIIDLYENDEPM
jgi:hypothetical protein